ncbi:MAG: DUF3616 domain-containing protein [Microcoleaceae cyanobacterium]
MSKSKSKSQSKLKFTTGEEFRHYGVCDASAAITVGDESIFLVADDEDNILRIYEGKKSGKAVAEFDVNHYFTNNPDKDEIDIEATSHIGENIYWITSHGLSKKGKFKPERRNFFATKLNQTENGYNLEQVGHSYTKLVDDLINSEKLKKYNFEQASKTATKQKGGLNIEGLSSTPNQKELLIGFRSPIIDGKALIITLLNPESLVTQENGTAEFGDPIELDLGGLGIRFLEYWPGQNKYVISAGAYDGTDGFYLYLWSGNACDKPEKMKDLKLPKGFTPEAIIIYPHLQNELQILSDDGSVKRDGKTECKDLDANCEDKFFRSMWIQKKVDACDD